MFKTNLWKRISHFISGKKSTKSYECEDYNAITFIEKLLHDVMKWKFCTVAMVMVVAIIIFGSNNESQTIIAKDFIAVIEIDGIIETTPYRSKVLNKLAENKHLKGVFLKINSPGGTITGSEILYNEIKRLREVAPVYALIYDLGASGGYMISLGASQIFAHESSITGSIGVLMQSLEMEDLATKIGAKLRTYRSTQYKAQPDAFKKPTPEIEEYMKLTIEQNHKFFAQIVANERKIPKSQINNVANGKIFMGKEAMDLHLIDGISNEIAVKKALQEKVGTGYDFKDVSLKEDEKDSFISTIIDEVLRKKQESSYNTKVMAIMKV